MRLNTAPKASTPDTVTYEGAPAYSLPAESELATLVASSLLGEGTFYQSGDERRERIDALVPQVSPEFAAKLAVYARSVWNLRTVSLYLVLSLASTRKAPSALVRRAICDVIQRADEIREAYAGALSIFGNKRAVPYSIKRGVADAMRKFKQYHYAKYQGGSGAVSFKDVLQIVHPTPVSPEQSAVFDSIMKGTLTMPEGVDTWERVISREGSSKESWLKVIPNLGYMAMLRNLRNLAQNDAVTDEVIRKISDKDEVARSRQLPFRFLSAARELEKADAPAKLVAAVMEASEHSLVNLPKLGDRVLIAVDTSYSMDSPLSGRSTVTMSDVSRMMGASLALATIRGGGEADLYAFATDAERVPVTERDVLLRVSQNYPRVGSGTDITQVWRRVQGKEYDAIVIFSDTQVARGYYGQSIEGPNAPLRVSFDLAGYGAIPFAEHRGWYLLAGWSDQALQALSVLREKGGISKIVKAWDW